MLVSLTFSTEVATVINQALDVFLTCSINMERLGVGFYVCLMYFHLRECYKDDVHVFPLFVVLLSFG